MHHRPLRTAVAALAVGLLPFGLVACGDTDETPSSEPTASGSLAPLPSSASTTAAEPPIPTASNSIPAGGTTEPTDAAAVSQPFGPECSRLPGSADLAALAQERVAAAAGDIPFLSRATALISTARLADTLDNASDITVFAPDDGAFADVGSSRLRGLLANPSTVDDVLRYHVVQGRLAPEDLAGSHQTLSGQSLEASGSGESFTVGDADVVCGNIQTANATVYVIDEVLTPPS